MSAFIFFNIWQMKTACRKKYSWYRNSYKTYKSLHITDESFFISVAAVSFSGKTQFLKHLTKNFFARQSLGYFLFLNC